MYSPRSLRPQDTLVRRADGLLGVARHLGDLAQLAEASQRNDAGQNGVEVLAEEDASGLSVAANRPPTLRLATGRPSPSLAGTSRRR